MYAWRKHSIDRVRYYPCFHESNRRLELSAPQQRKCLYVSPFSRRLLSKDPTHTIKHIKNHLHQKPVMPLIGHAAAASINTGVDHGQTPSASCYNSDGWLSEQEAEMNCPSEGGFPRYVIASAAWWGPAVGEQGFRSAKGLHEEK